MTAIRLLTWLTLTTGGLFPLAACWAARDAHRRGIARLQAADRRLADSPPMESELWPRTVTWDSIHTTGTQSITASGTTHIQ